MEKGSHSISAFLQEDKKMFQENSLEIMQRNNDVLKSIAPFYLYVLVAFSLFMEKDGSLTALKKKWNIL